MMFAKSKGQKCHTILIQIYFHCSSIDENYHHYIKFSNEELNKQTKQTNPIEIFKMVIVVKINA